MRGHGLAAEALIGGGPRRIAAQHTKGKLTARERIAALVDEGTFSERLQLVTAQPPLTTTTSEAAAEAGAGSGTEVRPAFAPIAGDGVVTGRALIGGRPVYLFAQDFTVFGGSVGLAHARKITDILKCALRERVPVIGINDSAGARIPEGVDALVGYAEVFQLNVLASGVIPQISAILGPCAGGAVYSPALTDFVFMSSDTGNMYLTGPDVIRQTTGEDITKDALGGAAVHTKTSGVAHLACPTDLDVLAAIRNLLGFLPSAHDRPLPIRTPPAPFHGGMDPEGTLVTGSSAAGGLGDDWESSRGDHSASLLDNLVPADSNQPYDIRIVVSELVDDRDIFELMPDYAPNILTVFARFEGLPVGIVANQPMFLAGALDIAASQKAARFVRFCDAFGIPLVTLVDVPGFLPGADQEYGGIIRAGASLLYAFAEATVPKVTLIIRKAYGGAFDVMSSKALRADTVFAWNSAEIAVLGAQAASTILYRNKSQQELEELEHQYSTNFSTPFIAAQRGYIDAIIPPAESRQAICRELQALRHKQLHNPKRKHANMPF